MAQTVYVVYHESDQGRVTHRTIEAIMFTKEDAEYYCDSAANPDDEYDMWFCLPVTVDTDITNLDYIYVVADEDYTLFASIWKVNSIHATIEDAEKACDNNGDIITMTYDDGAFW